MDDLTLKVMRYEELKLQQQEIVEELQKIQREIKHHVIEQRLYDVLTIDWRLLSQMVQGGHKDKHTEYRG